MRRKMDISVGEFYHIYNCGNDKRTIFMENLDYQRFKALLYVCNSTEPADISKHCREGRIFAELFSVERGETLVDIVVYCLMPNHFHLLIHEKAEGGITKFMAKLSTAYAMYFNCKNKRRGSLFEGRFKVRHADTDEYLKYLFAHIHLNPVKMVEPLWKEQGIQDHSIVQGFLNDYRHSSYRDWQGENRLESNIINRNVAPEYFKTPKDFGKFVEDWMSFEREISEKHGLADSH